MKKALLALALTAAFGVANAAQNVNTDVVIVGAGGAGLAAAVEAHDLGAKVIVVEKMAFPGGNTTRAAGGLNAAATPLQQAKGIYDTPEIMFFDTMKGGTGRTIRNSSACSLTTPRIPLTGCSPSAVTSMTSV